MTCLAAVKHMPLAVPSNPRAKPTTMRRQESRHVEQGKILLIVAHPGPQPDLPSSDSMLSTPMPALWSETCASLGWCQVPLEGRPLFRSSRSTVPHFSLKKTSQGAHQRCWGGSLMAKPDQYIETNTHWILTDDWTRIFSNTLAKVVTQYQQ